MDKNDILNYVTETPGNTNRAVLGSMLDSIGRGGSGVNLRTATLTINNSLNNVYFSFDCINENSGIIEELYDVTLSDGNYLLPFYSDGEGGAITGAGMNREDGERISMLTTGDINIEEHQDDETGLYDYRIGITGDCSITFQ